jgi:hypothetical protein
MWSNLRLTFSHTRWVAWEPSVETWVAALTAVLWIAGYYLMTHLHDPPFSVVYFIAVLLAIVIIPVWWFCWRRKHPLYEIGITTRYWKESLLISVIVGIPFIWLVLLQYGSNGIAVLTPQFLLNALILWEPFFVFCWLGLRFGRAFGVIPGIVISGACFGAYHLGTYPLPGVLTLAVYGMIFGAFFRITDNILSMWPVAWAGSSTFGTLRGGMAFSWPEVGVTAAILLVQVAFILMTVRRERHRRQPH